MKNKFSLTNWLSSKTSVSFTLAVGIIFLLTNYQAIILAVQPVEGIEVKMPVWFWFVLSNIDSFFFGLATTIIVFQAAKESLKIAYCCAESIMVFFNVNQEVIPSSEFVLGTYVALFSGFTLYSLGKLARQHRQVNNQPQKPLQGPTKKPRKGTELFNFPLPINQDAGSSIEEFLKEIKEYEEEQKKKKRKDN